MTMGTSAGRISAPGAILGEAAAIRTAGTAQIQDEAAAPVLRGRFITAPGGAGNLDDAGDHGERNPHRAYAMGLDVGLHQRGNVTIAPTQCCW